MDLLHVSLRRCLLTLAVLVCLGACIGEPDSKPGEAEREPPATAERPAARTERSPASPTAQPPAGEAAPTGPWFDGARWVPAVKSGEAIGFKVYAIKSGSLAARAGLEPGDTVVEVNEQPVRRLSELSAALADRGPGDVRFQVTRKGESLVVSSLARRLE